MRKEIYASLSIADHEIRILVSELHNGRLNILKVERVEHSGVINDQIVDETEILTAINKGLKHLESNLQFKVLRVILLINTKNVHKLKQTLYSDVNDPLGKVQLSNIKHIYSQAMNLQPLAGMELINVEVYRYKINGLTSRKLPLNEKAHRLGAEVDFYYADKDKVYQLANLVEKSSLEILDVCLDTFGIGKEASLFDKNPDRYMVSVNIERQSTSFGMFYKGRLVDTSHINSGLESMIKAISKSLSIPESVSSRLLLSNIDFGTENYSDAPVYLWSQDKKSFTCSQRDLMDIIFESSNQLFDRIKESCSQIVQSGPSSLVLVGEGSMIKGIDKKLEEIIGTEVTCHLPTTLGARDGALVSSLGAFYNYTDHQEYESYHQMSVDLVDFEEAIGARKSEGNDSDFSLRFKSLLKDPTKGGANHD